MRKATLFLLYMLATPTTYSADPTSSAPSTASSRDEHTMQNFLAKIIDLKNAYRIEDTVLYSIDANYDLTVIQQDLSLIKEQSRKPLQILFSDTSSDPKETAYRAIACQTTIQSITGSLKTSSKVLCVIQKPTFKDALNEIYSSYDSNENRENRFWFCALKYNRNLINWLTAFKTKQKSGEISCSLTNFNRELDAIFDNFQAKIIADREALQKQLSTITDAFKKTSNEDYFFPSTR